MGLKGQIHTFTLRAQPDRHTYKHTYRQTNRQRYCVRNSIARFEVLRAVWMTVKVFRITKPCRFQNISRRFGSSSCHYIQQKAPTTHR